MAHRGITASSIGIRAEAIRSAGDRFAVFIAGAPTVWMIAATTLLIAGFLGYTPFLTPADLTLSEAAAVRDHLEILRQIEAGADPDQPQHVRSNLVRPGAYVMTPLEAAVASGMLDTVQFLQHHGARMDATTLPTLICFANHQGAADIAAYLATQAPAGFAPRCETVRLPWTD
jgi:hypothetical protein